MTIHSEHPFLPPQSERDSVRQIRGRMASPVTVWAAGAGRERVGWTISSVLIADGRPARVLGLVDEDSEFWEAEPELFTVNLLAAGQEFLAEGFAGTAPAPGGVFTLGRWSETPWGPKLEESAGFLGVRRAAEQPRHVGWGLLIEGTVEESQIGHVDPLIHMRGRYRV